MSDTFEVEEIKRVNEKEVFIDIVSEDGTNYRGILEEVEQ